MQNWILDKDFYKSASYLDRHRLQANIYENIHGLASLLNLNDKLVNPKRSVSNHPNIKRWKGYINEYFTYICMHVSEWEKRGFKIDINSKNVAIIMKNKSDIKVVNKIPDWITDDLIKQHQQILLKKNYEHYKKYFGEIK
jgi:hypothetical protein